MPSPGGRGPTTYVLIERLPNGHLLREPFEALSDAEAVLRAGAVSEGGPAELLAGGRLVWRWPLQDDGDLLQGALA